MTTEQQQRGGDAPAAPQPDAVPELAPLVDALVEAEIGLRAHYPQWGASFEVDRDARDAARAALLAWGARIEAEREAARLAERVQFNVARAFKEERDSALAAASRARAEALEPLREARNALDRDRTGLAAALNGIRQEIAGRAWMRPEGGWANYSYEEHSAETLRQEVGWAFDALLKIAGDALTASGSLANAAVPAADAALRALAAGAGTGGMKP